MFCLYKRKHKLLFNIFKLLLFAVAVFALLATAYSKYMLPQGKRISKNYAITYVNKKIDAVISDIISTNNYNSESFFLQTTENNRITALTVNSMLINDFCSSTAAQLSKELNDMENRPVALRLGSITGINILNNMGPVIKLHIYNNGSTVVDYDTVFNSVGINQINFQVFLNIKAQVSMVLPMNKETLTVNRRVMLVNTVFSGEVPKAYLDYANKNH